MEKALQVLNELEGEGLIGRYAIGGAVAAIFYMEPFLTHDLDIFVVMPPTPGSRLLTLEPIYSALRNRGFHEEGECMAIEGIPVQFLPAHNALIEEALAEARETLYEQTPTRVLRPEHLLAIMVQTGRPKDRQRFASFLSEAKWDQNYLRTVLSRHNLSGKWSEWTA